jgi:hypothetical protein
VSSLQILSALQTRNLLLLQRAKELRTEKLLEERLDRLSVLQTRKMNLPMVLRQS